MNYDWNFGRIAVYADAFVAGTAVTVILTVLVVLLGTLVGVVAGLALRNALGRLLLMPVIEVFRALPLLVLLLFSYYLLSAQVIGVSVPAFWVCVIAFSLNLAAFTAELVRAAIENVEDEIIDAARSLGLSNRQVVRHIVLPNVFREIIPGMAVLYIGMLKMSSLASVINVREVVFAAQTVIAHVSRSLEAWVVVSVIYLALVLPASWGARQLERWARRSVGAKRPG